MGKCNFVFCLDIVLLTYSSIRLVDDWWRTEMMPFSTNTWHCSRTHSIWIVIDCRPHRLTIMIWRCLHRKQFECYRFWTMWQVYATTLSFRLLCVMKNRRPHYERHICWPHRICDGTLHWAIWTFVCVAVYCRRDLQWWFAFLDSQHTLWLVPSICHLHTMPYNENKFDLSGGDGKLNQLTCIRIFRWPFSFELSSGRRDSY